MNEKEEYAAQVIKYNCQKICQAQFSNGQHRCFAREADDGYIISITCQDSFKVDYKGNLLWTRFDPFILTKNGGIEQVIANLHATGNYNSFQAAVKLLISTAKKPKSRNIRTTTKKQKKLDAMQSKIDLAVSEKAQREVKREQLKNSIFNKK